jgi:transcriptional regulator GlxA family with amidase domain
MPDEPDAIPAAPRVLIPVFDGVELLDVTGPAEVFSAASRLLRGRGYTIQIVAARPGPVLTSSGVQLVATGGLPEDGAGTVVIPGALAHDGSGPVVDPVVVQWIRDHHAGWDRIASVCAGAHMLAAAGLLDGRRATTHWYSAEKLAHDFPAVLVDPDPIFIKAGRVWTCAGVTSGMDLALAMVAEDHDERLARTVARWLVMYLRRPGGQSQFSVPLSTLEPESSAIRELQHWIREHPADDLSVPTLARRANLSPRHLARLFARQTGVTPGAFVEASRAEAARRLLEQTRHPLDVVATRCGFGSVETLYRTFRRRLGTTPSEYRARFRLEEAP